MTNIFITTALKKRYGTDERADMIAEAFKDVNPEAIAWAILEYRGNFPPYPKDIADKVGEMDIDGVFMQGIRNICELNREDQLKGIRKALREALENGN